MIAHQNVVEKERTRGVLSFSCAAETASIPLAEQGW